MKLFDTKADNALKHTIRSQPWLHRQNLRMINTFDGRFLGLTGLSGYVAGKGAVGEMNRRK